MRPQLATHIEILTPDFRGRQEIALEILAAKALAVMHDLRAHGMDMLTIGQYLLPSSHHLSVERYVTPEQFAEFGRPGMEMGFRNVASGPMVRPSYHADRQAAGL